MDSICYWDPDNMSAAPGVRPSSNYSQEGTLEDYRAAVAEYEAANPPSPEPDWTAFNLAMIPPTAESTFEVWLYQFKEPYRVALTVASSEGNAERVQGQYEILKDLASPTAEQIAEWQGIADASHVPVSFEVG